eukprot:NODE_13549_length_255_cov_20.359223_g12636_i0.p2 GENE.NODE_13549_length_255_cov_20.359223_g12636_i0~~NODE_13549_length_255_cov_20.359223_g12636_i0.p2  ORF type:complete len:67 (-),score=15.52 NODE_13549_length_255_cov_20.359223_g12636_i0:53-223(-)
MGNPIWGQAWHSFLSRLFAQWRDMGMENDLEWEKNDGRLPTVSSKWCTSPSVCSGM